MLSRTRMRGKAQPDGRPALQIIETPFLLFDIPFLHLWTKVHVQRRFSINIYEKPAWWPFVLDSYRNRGHTIRIEFLAIRTPVAP